MTARRYKVDPEDVKIPMHVRARSYAGEALRMQVGIMRNTEAPLALRGEMAERIISRAYGKAPVTVQQDIRIEARVALDGIDATRLALMEATLIDALGKERPQAIADLGSNLIEAEFSEVAEDAAKDEDDE